MVPPLDRGETYEVNFPIPRHVPMHESKYSVTVDPFNRVEDLSEKNNKVEVDTRSEK
jgi:subtilase family serine protease